jgi:hypothetical protein
MIATMSPAEAVLSAGPLVVVHLPLLDLPLVNPEEGQLPERIFHDLECHADERLGRIGLERKLLGRVVKLQGVYLPLQRAGQIADDRVKQRLHPLVLIRRADKHGRKALLLHGVLGDFVDQLDRRLLLRQQRLHQLVAIHRQRLEHDVPILLHFGFVLGRHGLFADLLAVLAVKINGLERCEVDQPLERFAAAHRILHETRIDAQLLLHIIDDRERPSAGPIHLVDECQSRNVIALHLPIDGHRLRLHAAHGAEDENRPVEHA